MPDGYVFVDATFKALPDEYRVYIANTEHGTVSVDTRYAEEGEWVYITVNPNAGYRLSDLTVTRPSGNTVKVEHVRGNVFRFAMPGVRVTVDAEFVRTTMPFTDVSRGQWCAAPARSMTCPTAPGTPTRSSGPRPTTSSTA